MSQFMRFGLAQYLLLFMCQRVFSQATLSFSTAIEVNALQSPHAQSVRLRYENSVLTYENYRKGFWPTLQLSVSPLSFNRSMRLLQDPLTGEYRNVEDFANTSAASLTISQKVGFTGGVLSVTTGLSFLHEFSGSRDSYSSTPFSISYSQQLLGGYRGYVLERSVSLLQYEAATLAYYQALAREQREVAGLYIEACLAQTKREQASDQVASGDTLLHYARLRRESGYITDYDLNQIRIGQLQARNTLEDSDAEARMALHALKSRLGLKEDVSVEMPDGGVLPPALDEEEARKYAQMNNPDYKSIELRRAQARRDLHARKMATRFNATLSLNYGLNQYAHSFHAAYEHPNQRQSAGVTLSIPAFDWGINRNRRRMAENDYEREMISIDESEQEADEEIHNRTVSYNHAAATYAICQEQLRLAQEQSRLLSGRFRQGSASVYELISANRSREEALLRYLDVVRTLYSEYYHIRQLTMFDFLQRQTLPETYSYISER